MDVLRLEYLTNQHSYYFKHQIILLQYLKSYNYQF